MSFDDEEDDFDPDLGGDDDDGTVACPHCGREMFDDAEQCPHCGMYITDADSPARRWPWWVWLGFAAVGFVVWRWVVGG